MTPFANQIEIQNNTVGKVNNIKSPYIVKIHVTSINDNGRE